MSQVSQCDPEEDGNTISSSSSPKSNQMKHWFLTLKWTYGPNEPMFQSLGNWAKIHTTRCVFQLERGEGGYDHLQIQLSLHKKQRLNWFKIHLNPIVHCEITRNVEASFDYCSKTETRLWGPWIWPEPPCDEIIDDLRGVPLYAWQQEIIDIIDGPVDPRKIYWFWESVGNAGKTVFTRHLLINRRCAFFQGGKKSDIAHAYNGETICIFNFPREVEGRVAYGAIESLKDGLVFSPKYESRYKIYNRPHVLIFANWPPDTEALSADRWAITELS